MESSIIDWSIMILTLVLAIATSVYACDSRRSRQVAERTLAQLRSQNERLYQPCVVPYSWDGYRSVEIVNLGPGGATRIEVDGVFDRDGKRTHLSFILQGLAVGQFIKLSLAESEESLLPFPDNVGECIQIQILAHNVFSEPTAARVFTIQPQEIAVLF